jgi:hypothetical protein
MIACVCCKKFIGFFRRLNYTYNRILIYSDCEIRSRVLDMKGVPVDIVENEQQIFLNQMLSAFVCPWSSKQ